MPRPRKRRRTPNDGRILAAGTRFRVDGDVALSPVEAAEGTAPKVRRFSGTAYTGGDMQVDRYYYPVVIDLTGVSARAKTIPVLLNHDPADIVGHVDEITFGAQTIKIAGAMSGAGQAAAEVAASADNGFPWKLSVGVYPTNVEFVAEKATAKANGKTFTGPCNIVRAGLFEETSFVPIAADAKTSVKVAATANHLRSANMPPFEQWVQAEFSLDPATLTEEQRARLQARYDAEQDEPPVTAAAPAAPVQAAGAVADDQVAALRNRVATDVERIGAVQAEFGGEFPQLQATAIREGWDLARVKAELKRERELRDLRAGRPAGPGIHASGRGPERSPAVVEAALCLSAGIDQTWLGTQFDQATMNAAMARENRDLTLHFVMDEAIRASGEYYSGSRKSDSFIRAALQAERQIMVRAGFSTISISGILSGVANKAMLAAYDAVEVVWPKICAIRSHSDFKAVTQYRLDANGAFRKVGPDGELKHVGLSEEGYTNQLDTYGALISLTRQMMFNDDLGAFVQLPTILGRMCALRVEEAVFVLLLSNLGNFFHASNRNVATGATSALSIDALTVGEQKFRDQVDSNKKPILCSPSVLLVPTTLKVTGDNIYTEVAIVAGTSTAKQPARNPHAGKYPPVTSPYLNNTAIRDSDGAAITGQSDTAWYLFADPNVRAAIAIATLNGRMVPVIEASDMEFNVLGSQWRAYHDIGIGFEDPVGAFRAAGG